MEIVLPRIIDLELGLGKVSFWNPSSEFNIPVLPHKAPIQVAGLQRLRGFRSVDLCCCSTFCELPF